MKLFMIHFLQLGRVFMVIFLAMEGAAAADQTPSAAAPSPELTLPGCTQTCGDVNIPYPFGLGHSSIPNQGPCFLEQKFNLTCEKSSTLTWGNVLVSNIGIQGQMDVSFYVATFCNIEGGKFNDPWLDTASFSISSKENKFVTVGCNSGGALNSRYDGELYLTGCVTGCYGNKVFVDDGTCSGIGCCQVDIPPRMRNISIKSTSFNSSAYVGDCTNSFVVKHGYYNFSTSHLSSFPYEELPLVIDWTVGNDSCNASRSKEYYACMKNSYCDDTNLDFGYRCICNPGYEGNPYHPHGCTDIDECKTSNNTCISESNCQNTAGSYTCFCPKGQSGNGTKEGGCHRKDETSNVFIGVGTGFIFLFVGTATLYLIHQKRKLIKLKEKFFQQNGGFILLQKLPSREDSSQTAQIFTEEQLKKATNNFDESLIIGKGGYGTVFKGTLADNRVVAVKKSKIVDASQIEQFINEVVVLSQINHRNVVKLLGCCLETEVPLLVYEFVTNGTLFDFIHTETNAKIVTWKTRLRIAVETAGALAYLHSAASIPIIHRDVKSANILLDDTYTAKVSDFGASRLVPLDQTEYLATMVQGTIGYLDPEYMQTSQLSEKSDVYSFGVVLVELLTGEKPHSFGKAEEKRNLAMYFLTCFKQDRMFETLQEGILNEENKREIMEVAVLAARCLRLTGQERPTMKEVAMELEGIRLMEKHPWINTDQNLEETQYLLHAASSSTYEPGDSNSHQHSGYDSIRDHVLIDLDDGR